MPQNIGAAKTTVLMPGQSAQVATASNATTIQIALPTRGALDFSIYAPAVPGVLVAIIGLWVAHHLSLRRDRRKELRDLCTDLKTLADEAAEASLTAWRMQKSDARVKAVLETKRKLQAVGIAATHLARREKKIDVTQYVAELRRAATADPFEDPDREAEDNHTGPIFATLAQLLHEIECGYGGRYPR